MMPYKAKITKQGSSFYAQVIRVDYDGEEDVVYAKFFKTEKGALRSTAKYIERIK